MEVKLEKVVPIDAPAESAWTLLQDIPRVAECLPGAQITERIDGTHYKGQVKIKVGPVSAAFKGELEIKGINASTRELILSGKGADLTGTSAASMDLTARVKDTDGGRCQLEGTSVVTVTGKIASFGGRMLTQVSDQILKQFVANFADRVLAMGTGTAAEQAATRLSKEPKALSALVLAWHALVGFIKSFFGGNTSRPAG
ncbi:SRPBCC family protein [Petrachloros mirabilis]